MYCMLQARARALKLFRKMEDICMLQASARAVRVDWRSMPSGRSMVIGVRVLQLVSPAGGSLCRNSAAYRYKMPYAA